MCPRFGPVRDRVSPVGGPLWLALLSASFAALFWIVAPKAKAVAAEAAQDTQCEERGFTHFNSVMKVARSSENNFVATYTNHFNMRLQKCFSLQIKVHYEQQNGLPTGIPTFTLVDVDRGAVYAVVSPRECRFQSIGCNSNSEWEKLVWPLMKE